MDSDQDKEEKTPKIMRNLSLMGASQQSGTNKFDL